MDKLIIAATEDTPNILFNPENNTLAIRGASYPENPAAYYEPILGWLENYLQSSPPTVTVEVELHYFNSSSSKIFMDFFDMLNDAGGDGIAIVVNWFYRHDDEMAQEYGEEFQEELEDITFNVEEKQ